MPIEAPVFTLALEHHRAGRLELAERHYHDLLTAEPNHADALHLLGVIAYQSRRAERAVELIRKAISLRSTFAPDHRNLGAAYRALGNLEQAIECYRQAIQLDDRWADPHFNLGNALRDEGRIVEAVESYRSAISRDPQNADAHNQFGEALKQVGLLDEAVQSHERAISLRPGFAEAHFNLANALKRLDMLDDAIAAYRIAIELRPDYVDAHVNLGFVLDDQCRFAEAVACYDRAIELSPSCADARFNRSLSLLRQGDFARGWNDYEWRPARRLNSCELRNPVWPGGNSPNATVLVRGEQGIGDEIMFASCLPDVIERCAHCIVECDPRLVALFQRSFPHSEVRSRDVGGKDDQTKKSSAGRDGADFEVMLASLPRYLRTDECSFPTREWYLVPNANAAAKWQTRYRALGGALKVGISWRGGKDEQVRRARSTTLDRWGQLLATPNVRFINLQYGTTAEDLARASRDLGITIHHWDDSNPLVDLDDYAAQVAALDHVISVDNSTVHMAGALGVPTWVLLPFASDWRWLIDRCNSPWYASVRLFRQSSAGNWQPVFDAVARALRQLASQSSTTRFLDAVLCERE